MESRHCGQDRRIFFCPVHNASTPCSLQAFGIRCIHTCISPFVQSLRNASNQLAFYLKLKSLDLNYSSPTFLCPPRVFWPYNKCVCYTMNCRVELKKMKLTQMNFLIVSSVLFKATLK